MPKDVYILGVGWGPDGKFVTRRKVLSPDQMQKLLPPINGALHKQLIISDADRVEAARHAVELNYKDD